MESKPESKWGASYRLIAAEKWKAKSAAMGRDVTEALVKYANPQPGMQVLDVATGTGEPAISVFSRVRPTGQVTALDLSAELLQIADERAQARKFTNFVTKQGDVHDLPFPDQSFDLVTCRFGVMFFEDCPRALREIRRVLRPGSSACFVAWGPFDQPYWASTMAIVHKHVGGPLLAPGVKMFRFAEPGSLSTALKDAGFVNGSEEARRLPWNWPGSAEEAWEYVQAVSSPFRPLLDRMPDDLREVIDAEVHEAVRQHAVGDRIKFGVDVVLASGIA